MPWTEAAFNQRDRVTRLSSSRNTETAIFVLITRGSIEELFVDFIRYKARISALPFSRENVAVIWKPNWSIFIARYLRQQGILEAKK